MTTHVRCPACQLTQNTNAALLGTLGRLRWFRCRYCGWEWDHPARRAVKAPAAAKKEEES